VASRPYQAYSEAELLDVRRQVESSRESLKNQQLAIQKRYPSNYYTVGSYLELEVQLKGVWENISAIDQEFAARRAERG
jgi:hypothetical protein